MTGALLLVAAALAGGYANPGLLIETDELARLPAGASVRIVDVRADAGAYRAGHVPGAVWLAPKELDDARANADGFPIRPERAAALLGGLGIDERTVVVAYDDAGGVLAARLFFVLDFYGHRQTRLLNGGLTKWRREGRPLSTESPRVEPRRFVVRAQRDTLATAADVKDRLGKREVCLIDARSPDEYAGRDVRAGRGGHIPGATNVEWTSMLAADGTFKSAAALRTMLEDAGITPDREVIVYCQSGSRSALDYFVLRLLGYARVRNYVGSWNEWGNDASLPIAR
jgi:thiosulfate/3-mercaptopyruvate sulfurtransferase